MTPPSERPLSQDQDRAARAGVHNTHTPGPWQFQDRGNDGVFVVVDDLEVVRVYRLGPRGRAEQQANAHLIAAAPDMAAVLSRAYRELVDYEVTGALDASSLFVAIGDVLVSAGIAGFAQAAETAS